MWSAGILSRISGRKRKYKPHQPSLNPKGHFELYNIAGKLDKSAAVWKTCPAAVT